MSESSEAEYLTAKSLVTVLDDTGYFARAALSNPSG